ncbi:hypothetical protein ACJ0RR_003805, partial [Serratia liquefaciens]
ALSTGNEASLTLGGWSDPKTSAKYDITAAVPDQASSQITRDRATYTAGDDMLITVTLKDKHQQALAGLSALLNDSTVAVPNASLKSGGWKEAGAGVYTATYTAQALSTGNEASLTLGGWSDPKTSAKYDIEPSLEVTLVDPVSEKPVGECFTFKSAVSKGVSEVSWDVRPWTTNIEIINPESNVSMMPGEKTSVKEGVANVKICARTETAGPLVISASTGSIKREANKTVKFTLADARFSSVTVNGRNIPYNALTTTYSGAEVQLNLQPSNSNAFTIRIVNDTGQWVTLEGGNRLLFRSPPAGGGEIDLALTNNVSNVVVAREKIHILNWMSVTNERVVTSNATKICGELTPAMTMTNVDTLIAFYKQWRGAEWSDEVFPSSEIKGVDYVSIDMSNGEQKITPENYSTIQMCTKKLK